MEKNKNVRQNGDIVFWNRFFGFIKLQGSEESIYFRIKDLDKNYLKVSLLDKVTFLLGEEIFGKHIGKPIARDIQFLSRVDYTEYNRTIGILKNWNGRQGSLISPQLDDPVLVLRSNLINRKNNISNGSYFTFCPVKSFKNPNNLFALFAYPLSNERDLHFLKKQIDETNNEKIIELIFKTIRNHIQGSVSDRFEFELDVIIRNEYQNFYFPVVELLHLYHKLFSYTPEFALLKKYLPDNYLIQLWENGEIDSYDLNVLIAYFLNSAATTKRNILTGISDEHRLILIRRYWEDLIHTGKANRISGELKTFLDIVYRNSMGHYHALYLEAKAHLLNQLVPWDLVSLWFDDYLDELPERYVFEHFDINNVPKYVKGNEKLIQIIEKIYTNYILFFYRDRDFSKDYPELLMYLSKFKEQFRSKFSSVLNEGIAHLNDDQKFIIWLFEPDVLFDGAWFFEENWGKVNLYFLLAYLLKYDLEPSSGKFQKQIARVTQDHCIAFASNFNWNDFVVPINVENKEPSFLKYLAGFISKYQNKELNIAEISEAIYEGIPYYDVVHLRLWLFGYVRNERFSYVGFRESFDRLSKEEQELFRYKGDFLLRSEMLETELWEVEPCTNYEEMHNDRKQYVAFCENIFFKSGSLMLRKEDGEYSDAYSEPYSSPGLNRISRSSSFNKFEFRIVVKKNKIIEVEGMDVFFMNIQTGMIQKALNRLRVPVAPSGNQGTFYVEDWMLKKKVIEYLNENQSTAYEIKMVNELKYNHRKFDKHDKGAYYEKTALYTIETLNGLGIVWENVDLGDDRATVVFKCLVEEYNKQIDKIANAIVSFSHFRSTLSSTSEDPLLQIFRSNLGYVGKVTKQRGKQLAFDNWLSKLHTALSRPVPAFPDSEQMEKLQGWEPERGYAPRIQKKVKKMRPEDIIKINIDFETMGNADPAENQVESNDTNVKLEILNKMREINQLLLTFA